uniref:Gypsy retrotransposon integrase-like protein 1 n=1 Tax=Gouania willdenowi TaxID=441366 RepID=A0A8C5D830_GOUWI
MVLSHNRNINNNSLRSTHVLLVCGLCFLGHLTDQSGVRPDPDKVKAIHQLASPGDVQNLKRELGMGKNTSAWGHSHQSAFQNIKELLTTAPVLAFYDVAKPTVVSADTSSYGLGDVLLQLHEEQRKPEAYCSRCLTEAEKHYTQIKKEYLAGAIVIPRTLRAEILQKIHDGHQGLTKCRDRANASVWWPGLFVEVKNTVESHQTCQEQKRAHQREPLISTLLPNRPWKRIALDLCE